MPVYLIMWISQGAVEAGLAANPGDASLEALQHRAATAQSTAQRTAHTATQKNVPAAREMTEREYEAMLRRKEPRTEVEQLAVMNKMLGMLPGNKTEALRRVLGDSGAEWPEVPPFHTEISKAGSWPAQCDVEASQRKVWHSHCTVQCCRMCTPFDLLIDYIVITLKRHAPNLGSRNSFKQGYNILL